jgi:hypothetical protein
MGSVLVIGQSRHNLTESMRLGYCVVELHCVPSKRILLCVIFIAVRLGLRVEFFWKESQQMEFYAWSMLNLILQLIIQ